MNTPLKLSSSTRRTLLKSLAATGIITAFERKLAWAQSAPDYKALVHIYQQGGNDGNNTVIRTDANGYAEYARARPSTSGINITQASLLPIQASNLTVPQGLHPSLSTFKNLFDQKKMAIVSNMGTLIQPGTRDQYKSGQLARPVNLLSHTDQEMQMQTGDAKGIIRSGWGGRAADRLEPLQTASNFPVLCSINGLKTFTAGNTSIALALPNNPYFQLYWTGDGTTTNARDAALNELLLTSPSLNNYELTVKLLGEEGLAASSIVLPVLQNTQSKVAPFFANLSSEISKQLKIIALMLEGRAQVKLTRQIFFANQGGYDTHGSQLSQQSNLLSDLNAAIDAFEKAIAALGLQNNVTSFVTTDFNRTLKPNDARGTEHAWGNYAFAWGGAVKGGQVYGKLATLAIDGPDDLDSNGRWVPTSSVEQFAAPLLRWLGVPEADMAYVLPNMGAFDTRALAFI